MRRIDQATVQKILDAADIVEVVSDFVHLKRRGSGYIGLCPFHNERTPSFSVSKSKGICKCFSCGKGGSPVNFIMELEQMSFNEALRYLANKYHIEIEEHELTDKERQEASERESMLAINDFAMKHFEQRLLDTQARKDIGLSYFRERGINDAMIKRFHLGYALEQRDDLYNTALKKGFTEKFLLETGLCYKTERGTVQDRFRGRVIFPVFTISGKVVAFGGRTLRKDKDVAKYVNSPESQVYKKSNELYGLYQAKQAIVKKDKCILVEGYMDVISMHQSGVENVVASSGTSLTEGQIRLIHRFTENVTVIYDSDAAGIKASLRGIDMLLAEGLSIRVMQLPEGEDPDSFAQTHSSTEVEEYLASHEQDFISFKTSILLKGLDNDPIARSRAITDIVRSISVIPDPIQQTIYIGECARSMGIDEKVLSLQVAQFAADRAERLRTEAERERNRDAFRRQSELAQQSPEVSQPVSQAPEVVTEPSGSEAIPVVQPSVMRPYEQELVVDIVRYGLLYFCEYVDENNQTHSMTVLDYIMNELASDDISFTVPAYRAVADAASRLAAEVWPAARAEFEAQLAEWKQTQISEGTAEIERTAQELSEIEKREKELERNVEEAVGARRKEFCLDFMKKRLMSDADDEVRRTATALAVPRQTLSKIHTKFGAIATEEDRLGELVPKGVCNLKAKLIDVEIKEVTKNMAERQREGDNDGVLEAMKRLVELNDMKKTLAKYLGERILVPSSRR